MSENDENRVRLKVMGLSYSQIQSGAYALILAQVGGPMRIPVVIGAAEAQSIAMKMESITPPRPMTHDLFVSFAHAFGVKLTEVFIYKFEDGIFSSEITFSDGDRTVTIDSRTSDAIAIAMRTGAPIYTTLDILDATGFEMEIADESSDDGDDDASALGDEEASGSHSEPKLENYAIEELERTLARHIEREEYEEAARVAEILKRKRAKDSNQAD
ncbi:bifunctional nuclease family protein [Duncaniella sp.]|uniref:bifunctional nuclease family protein n=1 Tax=Duncaniella sp. TaxID=2518496 RepID=UPI0023D6DB27|nr:bifunctional nuclease family protein [Duncaniella sp.]MDE5904364.1 bifunctional nuclease family protein [Duncaniella sp.]